MWKKNFNLCFRYDDGTIEAETHFLAGGTEQVLKEIEDDLIDKRSMGPMKIRGSGKRSFYSPIVLFQSLRSGERGFYSPIVLFQSLKPLKIESFNEEMKTRIYDLT